MKRKFLILTFVCLGTGLYAQPLPPMNPVPLDGGLSLLLAAGVAYGSKKIYDQKKKEEI